MKKLFFLFLAAILTLNAQSQDGTDCPCCNEETRAFNFLLGDWEFVDLEGNSVSTSRIESKHDSCVIHEDWSLVDGSISGLTTIHYNYRDKEWRCIILDNLGSSIDFRAAWVDTSMYMINDEQFDSTGAEITFQIIYTPQEDGSISYIRRFTQDDYDKDQTLEWKPIFEGIYHPAILTDENEQREEMELIQEGPTTPEKKSKKKKR